MEKWLCWAGVAVGGILLILFGLDFVLQLVDVKSFVPFGGLSFTVDLVSMLASALLIYLSIDALRDLR